MIAAVPAVLVSKNCRIAPIGFVIVALSALLLPENNRTPLFVIALLPALLLSKNCQKALFVIEAPPALLLSRNSSTLSFVIAALPAVAVPMYARLALLEIVPDATLPEISRVPPLTVVAPV